MSDPYKNHKNFNAPQCPADGTRQLLHRAFRAGAFQGFSEVMGMAGLDGSAPISLKRENPLKTILFMDDDASVFSYQGVIANKLIARGCELTVPDKLFMVPADYALLSRNAIAKDDIVQATIIACHKAGRAEYMPSVEGWFRTTADEQERHERYEALVRNHRSVGEIIVAAKLDGSAGPLGRAVTDAQRRYWEAEFPAAFEDMPAPSAELTARYAAHREEIKSVWDGRQMSRAGVDRPLNLGECFQIVHERTYQAEVGEILREMPQGRNGAPAPKPR